MILVDTHMHLDDAKYDHDREEMISRAREAGVRGIITIGTGLKDSRWAADLAGKRDGIWGTVGQHPEFGRDFSESQLEEFRDLAGRLNVVAVGEVGLDYHHPEPPREFQHGLFRHMLRLARDTKKPLVIHQREAEEDTVRIMDEERAWEGTGVFHCFAGSAELAKKIVEKGWYLAVGGVLTFKNAEGLRQVVRGVPLKNILLETDAPWLAPQTHRGGRNEPAWMVETAQKLALLKGVTLEEVAAVTTANAEKLFGIKVG